MITLQINRAWSRFIRPHRSARATQHRLVINDGLPVEHDRQVTLHQGHFHRLPFPRTLLCTDTWRDSAVESAHIVRIQCLAPRVKDLNFVDTAQVHPAITSRRHAHFYLETKIFKLPLGSQIRRTNVRLSRHVGRRLISQDTVVNRPTILDIGFFELPSREVSSVKENNRLAELNGVQVRSGGQREAPFAGKLHAIKPRTIGSRIQADTPQRIAIERRRQRAGELLGPHNFTRRILPNRVAHPCDRQRPFGNRHAGNGEDAPASPEQRAVEPTGFFFHLKPTRRRRQ